MPVRWCAVYGEWHDSGNTPRQNAASQNAKAVADQIGLAAAPPFAVNLTFSLASSFTKPFMGQSPGGTVRRLLRGAILRKGGGKCSDPHARHNALQFTDPAQRLNKPSKYRRRSLERAGCTTELDYTEQTSWLLFLKYLDGLEQDKATEGRRLRQEVHPHHRLATAGTIGRRRRTPAAIDNQGAHRRRPGEFVDRTLFPHPQASNEGQRPEHAGIQDQRNFLARMQNKISSGCNLREIIIRSCAALRSQTEKHELFTCTEAKVKNMGNAGRNGGGTTHRVR